MLHFSYGHTFAVVAEDYSMQEAHVAEPGSGGQLAPIPGGEYLCLVCGKKLSNAQNGKRHVMQVHHTNQKAQCTICKAVYKNRATLHTHYYQKHGVTPAMVRNAIQVPEVVYTPQD